MMAYNFACTACGACCKGGGPMLSVSEMFKYQDTFISGVRFASNVIDKLRPVNESLGNKHPLSSDDVNTYVDYLKQYFPQIGSIKKDYYLDISPYVSGYSVGGNQCEALLENGGCAVHADKPTMCRAVPFNSGAPDVVQARTLDGFKAYGCMTESEEIGANTIFHQGKVVNESYAKDLAARRAEIENDKKQIVFLARIMTDHKGMAVAPDMNTLLPSFDRGGYMETSMVPVLFALLCTGTITYEKAENFVSAQLNLIEKSIAAALNRKNPAQRPRTNAMRTYIESYKTFQKMLRDDGFKKIVDLSPELVSTQ